MHRQSEKINMSPWHSRPQLMSLPEDFLGPSLSHLQVPCDILCPHHYFPFLFKLAPARITHLFSPQLFVEHLICSGTVLDVISTSPHLMEAPGQCVRLAPSELLMTIPAQGFRDQRLCSGPSLSSCTPIKACQTHVLWRVRTTRCWPGLTHISPSHSEDRKSIGLVRL